MQKESSKNSVERIYYKNIALTRSLNGKADITPEQIKAARALLSWSQADLAKHSGYSVPAINNIEKGGYETRSATILDVVQAFEEHNIEFIDGGVRNAIESIRIKCYEGQEAFVQLFRKITAAFDNDDGEMLICGIDEKFLMENFPHEVEKFQTRLSANPNAKVRILCQRSQSNGLTFKNFQKKVVPNNVPLLPLFIYKNCVLSFLLKNPALVILTYSSSLYKVYVEYFNHLWKDSSLQK
ncbi:MAG: helix-turn-helix transcriptional regulator [Alphaproteobacteria bacterium]|nr:helix-turn-helix transcriptional regulator [Alphaproteobacteria bacterium]